MAKKKQNTENKKPIGRCCKPPPLPRGQKRPNHRPSLYSKKLADLITHRIAAGETLLQISRDENMPSRATMHWWLLDDDKRYFLDKYKEAKLSHAQKMFEELVDIADDGTNDYMEKQTQSGTVVVLNAEHVARSRLRVDTRKWYLSKVLPKIYGERVDLNLGGQKDNPLKIDVTKLSDEELASAIISHLSK